MPKKQKFIGQSCYFCGAPAVSSDHLPPSGIFDKPKPGNRIEVPSCDIHNSQQSMDDEYFRWFVATASAENPKAEALIKGKVVSQFNQRPKLLQTIMKHSRIIDLKTPSGIYLGKSPAFEYRRDRIQNVITRMTKGFFLHFYNERLPDNYSVENYLLNPKLDDVQKYLLLKLPIHEIGGDVFSFRFERDHSDKYFSVWFFMFFDKTLIVSLTKEARLTSHSS